MSGLKTFMSCLALYLASLGAVAANPLQTALLADPLRTMASCAGRLSAQMEFEWMFDGPASEVTEARRAVVLEVLEAMMAPEQGRSVLHWRIEAKMAQSALLSRAQFATEDRVSKRANRIAQRNLAHCNALLLG